MYQLTLFDDCYGGACSGVATYFIDNLEDFEVKFKKYADEETFKRYTASKSGVITTDYYSDSPELNILQTEEHNPITKEDLAVKIPDPQVLNERNFTKKDFNIKLKNFYECPTEYHIDSLTYTLRRIKFRESYYLIARYKIKGIYMYAEAVNRWSYLRSKYRQVAYYGNPICEIDLAPLEGMLEPLPEDRCIYSNRAENYENDRIESFVWLVVDQAETKSGIKLNPLSLEKIARLLSDIPGEAG